MIDLCIKSQQDDSSYQNLWFSFLDQFFKENKMRSFTDKKIPFKIKDLLTSFLSQILIVMSTNVDIQKLIEAILFIYLNIHRNCKTNMAIFQSQFLGILLMPSN